MYEFPPASELDHLIGDTLVQICLDPHSTQFRFERNSITAEFDIEHIEPDGSVWPYENSAHSSPPIMLHRLLGKTIASINSEGLRLKIGFDNNAQLHLLSEICPYECGQIAGSSKFIVY